MTVQTVLKQDEFYIQRRRKELQPYLDLFAKQLAHIYTIMPAPKRILDLRTGEWEIINDEKWQELIDKILLQQQEYLKSSFPEFYHQTNL